MKSLFVMGAVVLIIVAILVLHRSNDEMFSGYCPNSLLAPGSYASPHDFDYANTRERPIRKYADQKLADPAWAWQNPKSCPYIR